MPGGFREPLIRHCRLTEATIGLLRSRHSVIAIHSKLTNRTFRK